MRRDAARPAHALPRGPEFRARRAGARARALGRVRRDWRERLPNALVVVTGLAVGAGGPSGGEGHGIAGVIGAGVVAVLFIVVFGLAMGLVQLRAEKLRRAQAAPRPRWQYLLIAAGWLAAAAGLIAAGRALGLLSAGPGWLARACGGSAAWFAVFGLDMLGRALAGGRLRTLFWWYRPRWVADADVSRLTPPPAPASGARPGTPAA
jgi:hypothetical protein